MAIKAELLEDLERRRREANEGGGAEKIQKRRAEGKLSAYERMAALFEEGTFQEFGMHAQHADFALKIGEKAFPRDGVVTGMGYVRGRPVVAYSHDFTVGGGALGRIHAKKICDLMDFAQNMGMPIVGINDSGGARIQEGVEALAGYGQIFYKNVLLSGVVPQISIIAGPCAGGAAYSPALTDFVIMTREHASMFICGPEVIHAATGEKPDLSAFATAEVHASLSGNIHLVAEDEAHALGLASKLLDYLPANNLQDPPHKRTEGIVVKKDRTINALIPESRTDALDTKQIIEHLVDQGSFFEIQSAFAKNICTGFARIEGIVVGVVANVSGHKAGAIDIDASDKASRFIRTCNVFNIPLVNLVDVPGFLPGLKEEQRGIIRHGAKMLFSFAAATVPKVTVIMRRAYGGAYLAMCSADMGADAVFAWPTAEIAVMGAEGAVRVLYRKEIAAADDSAAKEKELQAAYNEQFATPYPAAAKAMITDVIDPAETRSRIALTLNSLLSKRSARLPKKHGNIPL